MKFYIVTPTFNALNWLQSCIRSVADQVGEGVEVHHHVQDGGSSDGTPEWLASWQRERESVPGYTFTYESGKDAGMYDALNKAWEKIPSDAGITAHLNSDEQYLPGALKGIAEGSLLFKKVDVILASYFVVDSENQYICHRRPVRPSKWISKVACEISTCSCFHMVDSFMKHGVRLDTRFKSIADMVMYRDIVNANQKFEILPKLFTSVFSVTGKNMAWSKATQADFEVLISENPSMDIWFNRNIPYRCCNLWRMISDVFYASPQSYLIYTTGSKSRLEFDVTKPTTRWGARIS